MYMCFGVVVLFCHCLTVSRISRLPLPPLPRTLEQIPLGFGRGGGGRGLQSKDIFLTGLFPHPVNTSIVRGLNPPTFPPLLARALKPCTCLAHPSIFQCIRLGFMTQMLRQLEGRNICGAFPLRPWCPQPHCASGTD